MCQMKRKYTKTNQNDFGILTVCSETIKTASPVKRLT